MPGLLGGAVRDLLTGDLRNELKDRVDAILAASQDYTAASQQMVVANNTLVRAEQELNVTLQKISNQLASL